MFQKIAKHRANDASNDVHRPPLIEAEKFYGKWKEVSYSKNKNSFEISEQNGTICRYVQVKKRKFQNKNHPTVWVLAE